MSRDRQTICAAMGAAAFAFAVTVGTASAQVPRPAAAPAAQATAPAAASTPAGAAVVPPPPGYLIGPDDVLSIVYWRDKDMTTDVQVRPDGMISLSLLNDIVAAGLTPDQLREKLTEESKKYIEDPNITIVVKQINSRKVFITGQVAKQGPYPLAASMTVMQLISLAGGLNEYAKTDKIAVIRTENGKQIFYKFNYNEVISGRRLFQNIELKPGDTVAVQ